MKNLLNKWYIVFATLWSLYYPILFHKGIVVSGQDNISLGAMNGENRLLVTNEPVEAQDSKTTTSFWKNLQNIPQINKEKPEDHNMWPVGLGNASILTG